MNEGRQRRPFLLASKMSRVYTARGQRGEHMSQQFFTSIDCAKAAINAFIGRGFKTAYHQGGKEAVVHIIDCCTHRVQSYAIEYAIETLLDLYEGPAKNTGSLAVDKLSLAILIAKKRPRLSAEKLKERLILAAARAGYYNEFPELPNLLLQRNPTSEEVTLLVDKYVNNSGSSSSAIEKLSHLSRTYLPKGGGLEQIERIRQFEREFHTGMD